MVAIAVTGWNLRVLMAEKRLTNQQVADGIGRIAGGKRHWKTVSRWRQMDEMPSINGKELDALLEILECTRDELLGKERN